MFKIRQEDNNQEDLLLKVLTTTQLKIDGNSVQEIFLKS